MRVTSAEFVKSAVDSAHYPKDNLFEIALVGRSNVGKSSLINTFVNRKGLAKTSGQPGKTQTINFYRINTQFYLVDLPGFGYARVPMEIKKNWEKMMDDYLRDRPNLRGIIVILDPRREPGGNDETLFEWLAGFNLPVITVFTKIDKLTKNQLSSSVAAFKRALGFQHPVLFSSLTGEGKQALGHRIKEALEAERAL